MLNKITFLNKVTRRPLTTVADINKMTAAEINEIKDVVNAVVDVLNGMREPLTFTITSADFGGSNYQNAILIGMTPMEDFNVTSNDGSGTLLKHNDGYTFSDSTGIITMTPGNYLISINKPAV